MVDSAVQWVLASKKAIAAWVITVVVGVLKAKGVNVLPENFDWLQSVLEGFVVAGVVWFTKNRVGSVERKR